MRAVRLPPPTTTRGTVVYNDVSGVSPANCKIRMRDDEMPCYFVRVENDRPPFPCVAVFLWGPDVDIDSDGNSSWVGDPEWTELTVIDRRNWGDRVDVDPVREDPLVLKVRSALAPLAARTAYYLATVTGGGIALVADGPFGEPGRLLEAMGAHDVDKGLAEADAARRSYSQRRPGM